MRRLAWTFVVSVALVGVLVLAVFPTRAYLDQRHQRRQVAAEVARLATANRGLEERVRLLHTDAEIERLAREQYHLVRPGEEAYAVLPPAPPASVAPPPPGEPKPLPPRHRRRGFWARLASWF